MEPANTAPKPFVFVLMPFAPEFDDVYKLGIKPACQDAGAYAERVDEQFYEGGILQRIYNQISKADVIVADMTGKNPNVFYETGYAHALGKPVILLTRNADDIPFDLKHYPHIVYKGRIADLIPELTRRVAWAIQQPKTASRMEPVEVYIEGKSLKHQSRICVKLNKSQQSDIELRLDVHNKAISKTGKSVFQVGLIVSLDIDEVHQGSPNPLEKFRQPDEDSNLHLSQELFEMLPGAWESICFTLFKINKENTFGVNQSEKMSLIIYSEQGPLSFPFEVKFEKKERN